MMDKIENAWNKLKYACNDVGGDRVKLEVEAGQFKRIVGEAIHTAVNDARRPLVSKLIKISKMTTLQPIRHNSEDIQEIDTSHSKLANDALTQDTSRYGELP